MLATSFHLEGDLALVTLSGALDADAASKLASVAAEIGRHLGHLAAVRFDVAGIGTINSIGVQRWLGFVQSLPPDLPILFARCPIAFMDYANLIPSFMHPQQVESFVLPLVCTACGHRGAPVVNAHEILNAPEMPRCTRCGGRSACELEFEDYVGFMLQG